MLMLEIIPSLELPYDTQMMLISDFVRNIITSVLFQITSIDSIINF